MIEKPTTAAGYHSAQIKVESVRATCLYVATSEAMELTHAQRNSCGV